MNKYQAIALVIALANLLAALVFPPFDYVSPMRGNVPAFEGFGLAFGEHPNRAVNASLLQLELFVILANAAIAWLLLKEAPPAGGERRTNWQKVVLLGIGLNLILALLFPPMENYYAVTRAVLPSFDGFYFLFGEHGNRTIVIPILYIEVFVILVNGALLYLLFRNARPSAITAREHAEMIEALRRSGR